MSSSTPSSRTAELVVALAALAAACGGAGTARPARPGGAELALRDLDGEMVRLSDHRGEVVLLNFWATWCKPCAIELPHLQRLYAKYKPRGAVVVGIAMDGPESVANVAAEIRRHGLTFPVVLDPETHAVARFNPKATAPFSVLIGRDGVVATTREGYSAGDEVALEAELASLLDATTATTASPVELTSTTTASWRTDAAGYGAALEQLHARATTGRWQLAARADTATFVAADDPAIDDRYTVEKVSLTYAGRALELTLGDTYVAFGRGLALSLRKLDELGIDTTVRGAKLVARADRLEGTVVAGYANINNVDEATGQSADDPYDLIGGVQAQLELSARHRLGVYGNAIAFRDALGLAARDAYRDRIAQVGATFESSGLPGDGNLYVEAIAQATDVASEPDRPVAYGAYAMATAARGRTSFLVEAKAYGDLLPVNPRLASPFEGVAYNNPPTAERKLQPLENPQRDLAGGRLRVDWRVSPAVVTFASYGVFRDGLGYADPATVGVVRDGTIHDPYAGFELRWDDARSWAQGELGYRLVALDGSGQLVRGDGHAELDVVHRLNRCYSVIVQAQHLERLKAVSPILTERFREGTVEAGVRVRSKVTVSAGYDYTTEPTQPQRDYLHGNVAWDLTPSSSLRLFVGAARGGLRCLSGTCRVFPPFEGAKLTLTLRY